MKPVFMVFLNFSNNKAEAPKWMDAHNQWIQRAVDADLLLLAGSQQAGTGGAVLLQCSDRSEAESLIGEDPFVQHDVVTAEVHEISPMKIHEHLKFLDS